MPMPKAKSNENKEDFLSRCMGDVVMVSEYPGQKQRYAVCMAQWEKKHMDFKGFDDWIEIFKGGKQIDSQGREHDGDVVIEKALATFDAATHEPPLVIGHPRTNAPAYGWVQAVKKVGNTLLAKFKDVVPEFEAIARQGLFKKRSASFYPDGRLRHVGFLGAAPPAVKGLADLKFHDDADSICFENNIETPTPKKGDTMFKDFAQFMEFLKFWKKETDKTPQAGEVVKPEKDPEPGKTFTEEDIETAKKQAAKEAADAERKKVEAEFAEKRRQDAREARNQEISTWCDTLVKEGRVIPAWVKMGLKEFCLKLDADEVIEFSDENKVTALAWFKNFMDELPKVVEFKEIAKRGDDVSGDAGGKLEKLIKDKMKEDKDLSYSAAFSEVQRENPALVREYQQQLAGS